MEKTAFKMKLYPEFKEEYKKNILSYGLTSQDFPLSDFFKLIINSPLRYLAEI